MLFAPQATYLSANRQGPILAWANEQATTKLNVISHVLVRGAKIFYFKNLTINNATILIILIIGLMAGPDVSLYGSPTVSPVTAAL